MLSALFAPVSPVDAFASVVLMLCTGASIYLAVRAKDPGPLIMAGAFLFCLLAVLSCAPSSTVMLPQPAASSDPCVRLLDIRCHRVEACGGPAAPSCLSAFEPYCMPIRGISVTEERQCGEALAEQSCFDAASGQAPDSCVGIADSDAEPGV